MIKIKFKSLFWILLSTALTSGLSGYVLARISAPDNKYEQTAEAIIDNDLGIPVDLSPE